MKVPMQFEFDEEVLRRINARSGRSGRATRDQVRGFVETVVSTAVADLPRAKRRGAGETRGRTRSTSNAEPDVSSEYSTNLDRPLRADDPNDPCCEHKNCRAKRSAHGRMGLACPGLRIYQHFKGPTVEAEIEA